VPDARFEKLCDMYKPKSKVPATISITDIAGLVKGASEGAGLGNAFLSHIQAVDGIYHVVRAFENADIIHNEGEVDPIRDLEIIAGELIAKDIQWLDK
jgi:obg-like ATPase 1